MIRHVDLSSASWVVVGSGAFAARSAAADSGLAVDRFLDLDAIDDWLRTWK
jgi:hypothetical protein